MKLEGLLGITGLCKNSCGTCVICLWESSCSAGLKFGATSCALDCGIGSTMIASYYTTKWLCPKKYEWITSKWPCTWISSSSSSSSSSSDDKQ